jgi:hypothetical protein
MTYDWVLVAPRHRTRGIRSISEATPREWRGPGLSGRSRLAQILPLAFPLGLEDVTARNVCATTFRGGETWPLFISAQLWPPESPVENPSKIFAVFRPAFGGQVTLENLLGPRRRQSSAAQ